MEDLSMSEGSDISLDEHALELTDEMAWAAYEREQMLETLEHSPIPLDEEKEKEGEDVWDRRTKYVEHPHQDIQMQLQKVTEFLRATEGYYASVSGQDDSENPDHLPHPYRGSQTQRSSDRASCAAIRTHFVHKTRAHLEHRNAPIPLNAYAMQFNKPASPYVASAVTRLIHTHPYLWLWEVVGPDCENLYYLRVTTDAPTYHTNRLAFL